MSLKNNLDSTRKKCVSVSTDSESIPHYLEINVSKVTLGLSFCVNWKR